MLLLDARAGVANTQTYRRGPQRRIIIHPINPHRNRAGCAAIFDRVFKQVIANLPQLIVIALDEMFRFCIAKQGQGDVLALR